MDHRCTVCGSTQVIDYKENKTRSSHRIERMTVAISAIKRDRTKVRRKLDSAIKHCIKLNNEIRRLRDALEEISSTGPVNDLGEYDPYSAWSWCYDRAKDALKVVP